MPNQPSHRHPVCLLRPQRAQNPPRRSAPDSSVGLSAPNLAARPCFTPSPSWHRDKQVPQTGPFFPPPRRTALSPSRRASTTKHSPSATQLQVLILCSKTASGGACAPQNARKKCRGGAEQSQGLIKQSLDGSAACSAGPCSREGRLCCTDPTSTARQHCRGNSLIATPVGTAGPWLPQGHAWPHRATTHSISSQPSEPEHLRAATSKQLPLVLPVCAEHREGAAQPPPHPPPPPPPPVPELPGSTTACQPENSPGVTLGEFVASVSV